MEAKLWVALFYVVPLGIIVWLAVERIKREIRPIYGAETTSFSEEEPAVTTFQPPSLQVAPAPDLLTAGEAREKLRSRLDELAERRISFARLTLMRFDDEQELGDGSWKIIDDDYLKRVCRELRPEQAEELKHLRKIQMEAMGWPLVKLQRTAVRLQRLLVPVRRLQPAA